MIMDMTTKFKKITIQDLVMLDIMMSILKIRINTAMSLKIYLITDTRTRTIATSALIMLILSKMKMITIMLIKKLTPDTRRTTATLVETRT